MVQGECEQTIVSSMLRLWCLSSLPIYIRVPSHLETITITMVPETNRDLESAYQPIIYKLFEGENR